MTFKYHDLVCWCGYIYLNLSICKYYVLFVFYLLRGQYLFKPKPGESPPGDSFFRKLYPRIIQNIEVSQEVDHLQVSLLYCWGKVGKVFFVVFLAILLKVINTTLQGLSQDFRTASPAHWQFQNDPSNPFWESVFTLPTVTFANPEVIFWDPILCEKQENMIQWKRTCLLLTVAHCL